MIVEKHLWLHCVQAIRLVNVRIILSGEINGLTHIHFLGGCKTIGSSAYLIEEEGNSVLLDFGVSFGESAPSFPKLIRPRNLAVALSHAHLDHSGGLPLLFASGTAPVYMTAITRELVRMLLKDFIRISEYYLPFEEYEMQRLFRRIKIVKYDEPVELRNGTTITFIDAGHIPGSAAIQVETDTHRFYYSGDINTIQTQMLNRAQFPVKNPDVVLLESTYALTRHDPRPQIEKAFVEAVSETIEQGGSVLIPAFAVARSQEILCILAKHRIECPIYLDGMAREAARIFLRHPTFFRDYPLLRDALKGAKWIRSKRQRANVMNEACVMVAPAGMLRGGAAAMYLGQILDDAKNAVMLVGFQIPGTPGRNLIENNVFDDGVGLQKVKAQVHLFDFSSHAGQDELLEMGKSFSNASNIFTVHGESEACEYLASSLKEEYGANASAAEIGQRVEL